jgi:hypothetical protein
MLCEQSDLPWEWMVDVPPALIYNMNRIGFDFTGHQLKVLTPKQQRAHSNSTITPDEDGKMKKQITGFLTTCASGK